MNVSIIGSGNVATQLGKALYQSKIEINAVWSRNPAHALTLAQQINSKTVASLDEISNSTSEIVIIAVKDDAIKTLVEQLKNYKGIVVHVSGAMPMDILSVCSKIGVFYPIQTFSKDRDINFKNVPICLEANSSETFKFLNELAVLLTSKVYEVNSEQRKILHLAAVFACNFPNYLYDIAGDILSKHQLDFEIIRPLIRETAEKVQKANPKEMQTGPAIRKDMNTMQAHESLLANHPEWQKLYRLMSTVIAKENKD